MAGTGIRELGPVAAGTAGTAGAAHAVARAAAEAAARGKHLTLMHGTGAEQLACGTADGARLVLDDGHSLLKDAAEDVALRHPDLKVDTVLSRARPVDVLLEPAGPDDTLVVGTRGLGGFSGLLLGSVGLAVAAGARGPAVVVRAAPDTPTRTVAVAVRDDGDRAALRFAARTARQCGAALRVIGVWASPESVAGTTPAVEDVGAVADARTAATRRTLGPIRADFPGLAITEDVLRVRPVAGALVAGAARADLLVLGVRRPHMASAPGSAVSPARYRTARGARWPWSRAGNRGGRP